MLWGELAMLPQQPCIEDSVSVQGSPKILAALELNCPCFLQIATHGCDDCMQGQGGGAQGMLCPGLLLCPQMYKRKGVISFFMEGDEVNEWEGTIL